MEVDKAAAVIDVAENAATPPIAPLTPIKKEDDN
jgi:hypothetical protein